MYFYPSFGLPLGGPFDQSPWTREISVAMSKHVIPFEEILLMCPARDCSFCDHVMGEPIELWLIEFVFFNSSDLVMRFLIGSICI